MFQKKRLLALSVLLVLSVIVAACGGNNGNNEGNNAGGNNNGNGETIEIKFLQEEVDGQVQYEYAEQFEKLLEAKVDNVDVVVYEYGAFGGGGDQADQLRQGVAEMAIVSPGFIGGTVPDSQIFNLHYLFTDIETTHNVLNESEAITVDLVNKYEEKGFKVLDFFTEGFTAWTANKEIRTPEDFNGLKIRVQESPLQLNSYRAYDANPQPMDWADLYTGLDNGTVDGQENPLFFIYDESFHEVQSHVMISQHNNYVASTVANPEWYEGLSDELRTAVDETIAELDEWVFETQTQLNADAVQAMEEAGVTIVELTDEERAQFEELALEVRDFYRTELDDVDASILDKLEADIEAMSAE